MTNTFHSQGSLTLGGRSYKIARLGALTEKGYDLDRLPFALRILLENLLRRQDGQSVTEDDIEAMVRWNPQAEPSQEIAFMPARVLLQDFTGVPAVVDLAAMRNAMQRMGGDPTKINPLQPAELVIDHSVQVDEYGSAAALLINSEKEFERNGERYVFLRWGQNAFENFRVVPPSTGIVHQVNLEYLARGVMVEKGWAYPDTLVGTDSHTTMINGLGVLGWGVGGIEAEAAMLGQPISMLIPQVVGFRLEGRLPEGATATDLVLRVVEMLRAHGVVGRFVEFFGEGLAGLALADRATLANMAPEYGATCGIFPVDQLTLDYLRFTGRDPDHVDLVEAYMKEQGLFHTEDSPEAEYSSVVGLDLATVEASMAGPRRPQDRLVLSQVGKSFADELDAQLERRGVAEGEKDREVEVEMNGEAGKIGHGSVAIAAITSCTNTSNPSVMVAAGLLARKAVALGLATKPWVKTSLAPGSKVVTDYLTESGLLEDLEKLRFHVVGYGCTTCIGNSGPLPEPVRLAVRENDLIVASVLSGNRNFEGRIGPDIRANYLASPPLVVAYALAGHIGIDLATEPLGTGSDGEPVYLRDIWPSRTEVASAVRTAVKSEMFSKEYGAVFEGDDEWRSLPVPEGSTYAWERGSTYVKEPPYFVDMPTEPAAIEDIEGARVLGLFGDSITTDHISPAGAIMPGSPAGEYLEARGVAPKDFNSYGSRRGNHEVMMRGTFANVRLRNRLVAGVEGAVTLLFPEAQQMSIFDAAERYRERQVPLVLLAGKEYGTGSSRDWAAKGPNLLGVRAVVAQSYERIHRSNLVGMGILPLEFLPGESPESLGLSGREIIDIGGLAGVDLTALDEVLVRAKGENGESIEFRAKVRLDTPQEAEYYRHGGILHYVLRQLLAEA